MYRFKNGDIVRVVSLQKMKQLEKKYGFGNTDNRLKYCGKIVKIESLYSSYTRLGFEFICYTIFEDAEHFWRGVELEFLTELKLKLLGD